MGAGGRGRRRRGADGAHFLSGETTVRLAEHLVGFRSPLEGGGDRVAPRPHGDVFVVLGTPSIHADLEKGGGGWTLNWMLCLAEGESVCGKHKRISCLPFRMRRECRIRIGGK